MWLKKSIEMSNKITKSIISAFLNKKPLSISNSTSTGNELFLFGNKIAEHRNNSIWITDAGWQSKTTHARLNEIPGVSLYTRNGISYLNGNEWSGEWTEVKK